MKAKNIFLSVLLTAGLASPAFANPVLTDLTTNDYITVGTLDWAWAAPVASATFGPNVLSQAGLHQGWREATDAEWANRPVYSAFMGKCASQYWNSLFTHCDFGDGQFGYVSQHWMAGNFDAHELWYVRSESDPGQVPEPASAALAGVALLALLRSRKKQA